MPDFQIADHIIYRALVEGLFSLAISGDILLEYEEVIQKKYSVSTANNLVALLKELPNVKLTTAYYRWQLVDADPDDNKYCDCAIAGRADYLISQDRHFAVLQAVPFPRVNVISMDDFTSLLKK